ncbi:sialate O-acetylesterase [Emticicia sp. BO119]|uniref:sialate O-acetylesterase n=1 Tax=Emticicia sp. BO119 TaxID=2757768 RepID=UPI0015F1115E|nr:sialate O-acetylesterase [Emticicia sp. BO119]MBA4849993.1 sialate O-acetylesterase [Emticicia sp. BO119]
MKFAARFIFLGLVLITHQSFGEIKLPRLISNGMVLQQNTHIKVWGWAKKGEAITLQFNNQVYNTTANTNGKWLILLPTPKAGGPYEMDISGENYLKIKDILIGEVWVCSGQSNMVLPMERVKEKYADIIAKTNNPLIRHFFIPTLYNFYKPLDDLPAGKWEAATPENILRFTATGYFFAKDLFEKYHVPIGLINASVGGTPVESWISEEGLKPFPKYMSIVEQMKDSSYIGQVRKKEAATSSQWYAKLRKNDLGMNGPKKWFEIDYDASVWKTMIIPDFWENAGLKSTNGVVWFRKEIEVPESMTGKTAKLFLGRIVDSDSVYVNGKFVGTIGYQYPPRRYEIPKDLLKPGKNIMVVRIINVSGSGGFIKDKPYEIKVGDETIDLKGTWQYKLGAASEPLPAPTFFQYKPLGLYNSMISPLINYTIKGVIWYQGEANVPYPGDYHPLFSTMIQDWRQKWNQGNFPFLYVQLANFLKSKPQPSESLWAELREAQLQTLDVPATGMAVITDIGEWNDIHPLNKEDVGKRLALAAEKVAYQDKNVVFSGPTYQSMKIKKNRIILSFSNIGSGLMAKGGSELKHFAIAGADKKFVWAKAEITDNKVEVWNDTVPNPVVVRYAWADNPDSANLYNQEGLPASPFRTDSK